MPTHPSLSRHSHSNRKRQTGFTLIELLVVISLSVVIVTAAASLFYTSLVTSTKKDVLTTVKNEGDFAISQMEFLLRNAVTLVPDPANPTTAACRATGSSISFKSVDDGITTLTAINGKIASQSATSVTPSYLTSDDVTLNPITITFSCRQSASRTGTYVTIDFTLEKVSPDINHPATLTQQFKTSVTLRNQ
jgi:prepilin-type N-terminal cleavage/methylation domain-containing protein